MIARFRGCALALSLFATPACAGETLTQTLPTRPNPPIAKTLALLGDSITFWADTTNIDNPGACAGNECSAYLYQGFGTWANIYSQYRVTRVPNTNNCGSSGITTAQILLNVSSCLLKLNPDVVIYQGGGNDASTGVSCATATANNRAIYSRLLNAGIAVIKVSIYPRASPNAFTAAQANMAQCVNEYDRRYAEANGARGFYFVDCDPVLVDPTQTSSWSALSNVLYLDGAHLSMVGASLVGNLVAQQINTLYPSWRVPVFSNADVYDATNNPAGNLLPNSIMAGTGGAIFAGCSGTAANSSNLGAGGMGGATCVGSSTTLADNRNTQTITLGGTSTGSNGQVTWWQNVATPSNINIGDVLEGILWINIGATTNVSGVVVTLKTVEGGVTYQQDSGLPDTGNAMPTPAVAGYLPFITPRRTVTSVPSSAEIDVKIFLKTPLSAAAVSGTIAFTSANLRKVFN